MSPVARYDGLAEWYDDFLRDRPQLYATALESLGRLLGHGPGRCLDVGCGTGLAFDTLVRLGWSVTGLDVSADQLRLAAGRGADELVQGDAADPPFAEASFDAAASLMTHTDFDDVTAVFRGVARVLRPGGRFAYVGTHPCFMAPMVRRDPGALPVMFEGYRRAGWWDEAPGFRLGREGVRGRVGANHVPLADFLNAVLEAGLVLERVEEPGDEDYPLFLAFAARRGA